MAIDRRRFWQPARCPVCKTPIDPWRRRRFWWWLTGRGPKSRVRLGPFGEFNPIEGSLFLWLLVCIGVASVMWGLGDSWWVGTALLFAGRWPWMVPVVPLGLAALLVRRRTGIGLALANVLVVLFPIMGFSLGLGRFATRGPALGSLRIISYNMAGRAVSPIALSEMIHAWSPDVVAIQECGPNAAEAARLNPSYRIHESSICLISRLPIDSVYLQPRRDIEEIGGSGQVVRYRIRAPFGSFDLTNVHLETPREGLAALNYSRLR